MKTIFIICVCNNQLLDWMENELIWILSHVPGLASVLPGLTAKLHAMKEKYIDAPPPVPSHIKVNNKTIFRYYTLLSWETLRISNYEVSR